MSFLYNVNLTIFKTTNIAKNSKECYIYIDKAGGGVYFIQNKYMRKGEKEWKIMKKIQIL